MKSSQPCAGSLCIQVETSCSLLMVMVKSGFLFRNVGIGVSGNRQYDCQQNTKDWCRVQSWSCLFPLTVFRSLSRSLYMVGARHEALMMEPVCAVPSCAVVCVCVNAAPEYLKGCLVAYMVYGIAQDTTRHDVNRET
ncbi:hypothetical protein CBL_14286 [Carabus blaptoides fortunei]